MSAPVQGPGLFASLRQLLATALEMAKVRLELLQTEFEQEKLRVFDGLLWAGLALMLLGVGVLLLCGFIVLLVGEGYRLAAVGVLTLLFLGGGALLMRAARERLRSPGGLMASTLAELERDRAGLVPHDGPGE